MEHDIPFGDEPSSDKPKEEEENKNKQKPKPSTASSSTLSVINDEDEDEDGEDEDDGYDNLDEDADSADDKIPFYKTPIGMGVIALGVIIVGVIAFLMFKPEPEPPPAPPVVEAVEQANPKDVLREELYQVGIGKESLVETRIYEQGNIESEDFRKDFLNTGAPENYVLPIELVAVNESISYKKHRTVTGNGMDVYWVEGVYKGNPTVFTVPYYIWRTLAKEGVMNVVIEVITDANKNVFVGSVTAVPPSN